MWRRRWCGGSFSIFDFRFSIAQDSPPEFACRISIENRKSKMQWVWLRALVYMMLVGGGWLVLLPGVILYCESGMAWPALRSWPWLAAGLCSAALGTGLALWAGYHLIQYGHGTPLPLDPPRRLVMSGPYAHVRNPQAIGMMLLVCGEVLAVASAWLWLMLPLTAIYLECLVGPLEARQLARDFGQEYDRYAARVGKWTPRRGSHS
jgi:protein-S-isoprenylcysteine O-methyltransferase Ste14